MAFSTEYSELGAYRDLPDILAALQKPDLPDPVQSALWFDPGGSTPKVMEGRQAVRDGVKIQELSWRLPYGPLTQAYLLTPAEGEGPWDGVVALHDHGGFRWLGKEKIADGVEGPDPALSLVPSVRNDYSGLPWANRLARRGYAVLVHDVCSWGSRRFAPEDLTELSWTGASCPDPSRQFTEEAIHGYNAWANTRETTLVKWLNMASINLAAVLGYEDRVACDVLAGRPECRAGPVSVIGHSGGGARAVTLATTYPNAGAVVVSCMMSTWRSMIRYRTATHTFQMIPFGLGPEWEYPDMLRSYAPNPLLVLYGEQDDGFSLQGMQDAHKSLESVYNGQHATDQYQGIFCDSGHSFNSEMQETAFRWLDEVVEQKGLHSK